VLLEAVVQEPEAKLGRLPLLTSVEQQLLAEWNETASELQGGNVVQLFEDQVRRTPEQVAVVCRAERLSYRELDERAESLAAELQRRGVGPEILVGLLLERSVGLVAALFGVLKAGGAYVPLDPAYPRERLRFLVEDAKPKVIVTHEALRSILPDEMEILIVEEAISRKGAKGQRKTQRDDSLAYVIYTSGSTGKPKGTLITHGGLLNYLSWTMQAYPLAEGRGTPLHSSLSFDLTVTSIYPALLSGRYVEIIDEAEGVLGLSSAMARQPNYSLVKLTPAHVQLLATQLAEQPADQLSQALVIGGENLLAETVKWWREHSPQTRLFNEYGPTETVVGCCVYEVQPETDWAGSIPIGKPIPNTRLYILDACGQQVPAGVTGELYIGGSGVGRGYLQRADLTAECFVPDAYSGEAGARLYRSGDVVQYRADGVIEYLGRRDEQVKVRGYRVELGEIEAVLSAHEQVSEAAVIADQENGEKRLVAYFVGAAETAELKHYLQQRLPEYMIPSAWIKLETLPLTTNGKVDRHALPTPGATTRIEPEDTYAAPRTPVEEMLASIWSEVLQVNSVGIYDNFFALGGHSLLATQVVSRIRDLFRVELPLRYVFEYPTVNALAAKIEANDVTALIAPPIIPVLNGGPIPLSFAQQRLWFIDQLEANTSLHNLPSAYLLKGQLNVEALEYSINEVLRRHASLRTYFVSSDDGSPAQRISPPAPFNLPQRDLRQLPEPEREIEARRVIAQEGQRPFQLSRAPLLRYLLLRTGEEEHIFILTIHHIITDGWSMGVFVRELAASYESYIEQRPASLPELTVQYADFAVWQRNWLRGEVFDRLLDYWKQQLKGAPARLELPTDRPRPPIQTYRGSKQFASLSPQLAQSLRELSRREGATLYMTLLAGFITLLHYYTRQSDIVIGTDVANRNRGETESLIGFFVNELVMRTDLSGNPTFHELVARVREVTLGAYSHQDMPFDRLVDALKIERSPAHHPLFQVCFLFQNTPSISVEVKSLTISMLPVENAVARFDLVLHAWESGQGMQFMLEYNADLFMPATITRLLDLFKSLLDILVQQPKAPLDTMIDALAQADRTRLTDKVKALEEIGSKSLKKARRRAVATHP
jgi:amino acid adenylation domain-containing protein